MSRPKDFPVLRPEPLSGELSIPPGFLSRAFNSRALDPEMQNEQQRVDFGHITGLVPSRAFMQFQPDPNLPFPVGMPSFLYSYIFEMPPTVALSDFKPYQLLTTLKDHLNLASMDVTPYDAFSPARQQTDVGFMLKLNGQDRTTLLGWFAQNREKVQQFLDGTGPLPSLPKRGGAVPVSVTVAAVGDTTSIDPHGSGLPRGIVMAKPPTRNL